MLTHKLNAILRQLRQELAVALGDDLDSVILYGSQARGQERLESDIDILVLVRDDSDYAALMRKTSAIVGSLSLENDVVISRVFLSRARYEHEHTPFLLNVRREGVLV